jgi:hypothetical protein
LANEILHFSLGEGKFYGSFWGEMSKRLKSEILMLLNQTRVFGGLKIASMKLFTPLDLFA